MAVRQEGDSRDVVGNHGSSRLLSCAAQVLRDLMLSVMIVVLPTLRLWFAIVRHGCDHRVSCLLMHVDRWLVSVSVKNLS